MNRFLMLATWLGLPVYVWQGIGVRLRTERLLPPEGPLSGVIDGDGEALRLMVLGDSSAAGVGVSATSENLAGQLAPLLNARTGRPVIWRTAGFNSATSGELRDFAVAHLTRDGWTHIVLSIGTNDVKNLHTRARFKRDFGGLLYALKARFPQASILWSPPVDMRDVPALPSPLAEIMEIRAREFVALGSQLCAERGAVAAPRLPVRGPEGFSSDGFHAGLLGYRAWAEHLVPLIVEDLILR